MFQEGDWITQVKLPEIMGSEGSFEMANFRKFYEYVGYAGQICSALAYPIVPGRIPVVNREKFPEELTCERDWRLCTPEEKAALVVKCLQGRPKSDFFRYKVTSVNDVMDLQNRGIISEIEARRILISEDMARVPHVPGVIEIPIDRLPINNFGKRGGYGP